MRQPTVEKHCPQSRTGRRIAGHVLHYSDSLYLAWAVPCAGLPDLTPSPCGGLITSSRSPRLCASARVRFCLFTECPKPFSPAEALRRTR